MSKGRRSYGEGTLRLRADGRWECTLMDGYDNDGRRVLKSFYGKSQKQVKEKLKRIVRLLLKFQLGLILVCVFVYLVKVKPEAMEGQPEIYI